MASKGYTEAILNTLPAELRKPLNLAFAHVMDDARLGGNDKAQNFAWYAFESTTAAVAGDEFSIRHGLNQIPSKVIPYLDLNVVGSQIVPLVVSRAPDSQRVYFTSSSTSALVRVYLEV